MRDAFGLLYGNGVTDTRTYTASNLLESVGHSWGNYFYLQHDEFMGSF